MAPPVSELPHVDAHSVAVEAASPTAWEALLSVVEGAFSSSRNGAVARVLGCHDTGSSGPRPLTAGSAFPGFHVAAADVPQELVLAGRHRFSTYALIFRLEPVDAGVRLRAETRAAFPGVPGRLYRALVIGTGFHVRVVTRLLATTKRRAERA